MGVCRVIVVGCGLSLLAACSTGGAQGAAGVRPVQSAVPPVRSIAVSPAAYMAQASSASLLMVRVSQLVAGREGSTRLGDQARRVLADHQGIAAQLSFAGRRLNLLPSATLLPEHQALFEQVSPGATQEGYQRVLGEVPPGLAALHEQYRRLGTSATLRPVASMAAPVVQRELSELPGR